MPRALIVPRGRDGEFRDPGLPPPRRALCHLSYVSVCPMRACASPGRTHGYAVVSDSNRPPAHAVGRATRRARRPRSGDLTLPKGVRCQAALGPAARTLAYPSAGRWAGSAWGEELAGGRDRWPPLGSSRWQQGSRRRGHRPPFPATTPGVTRRRPGLTAAAAAGPLASFRASVRTFKVRFPWLAPRGCPFPSRCLVLPWPAGRIRLVSLPAGSFLPDVPPSGSLPCQSLVGPDGFEPPTSPSRRVRAAWLRYGPRRHRRCAVGAWWRGDRAAKLVGGRGWLPSTQGHGRCPSKVIPATACCPGKG
jgi:hypothetical protein